MNIETAKASIGKMVWSRDAGHKMIKCTTVPHGTYKLLQITKGGCAILAGREEFRIPTSLISLAE